MNAKKLTSADTKTYRLKTALGLLLIPLTLSYFAFSGYGFSFKAAVTASCSLIIIYSYGKQIITHRDVWLILAAFIFSVAGDWFLSNKHGDISWFAAGIGWYFVAHGGYLVFALIHGRIRVWLLSLVLAGYLAFFYLVLFHAIDSKLLLGFTFVYLVISCFSFAAAAGMHFDGKIKWSFLAGIFLILFSDTIIAFHEFTSYQTLNFLILPTYYLAHIMLTVSLIYKSTEV